MYEEKISDSAYFVTLTYDDKYLPFTKNGYMGLRTKDLQDFFKRLRRRKETQQSNGLFWLEKSGRYIRVDDLRFGGYLINGLTVDKKSVKYYGVGEYGSRTFRPHFHAIIFNASTKLVEQSWQKGNIHFGQVTGASVGYTLKYLCKPKNGCVDPNDDRERERAYISQGMGIGYVQDENYRIWHYEDLYDRMYVKGEGGRKMSMPRYYKDKLFTDDEKHVGKLFDEWNFDQKFKVLFSKSDFEKAKVYRQMDEYSKHVMSIQNDYYLKSKTKI